MNTEETKKVVFHIDEGVEKMLVLVRKIKARININTGIFSATLLVVCWMLWMGYTLNVKQERNYILATEGVKQSALANAKLDATEALYTTYIKTTIGQILDKLQKDNPQIVVPKAPEPRPPGVPPPSEKELERPRVERPKVTPTPTPKPKVIYKTRYKTRPTPRPLIDRILHPLP